MARLGSATAFIVATSLVAIGAVGAHASPAKHPGATHGQGLGADTTPYVTPPHPYDGHLAGDGIPRTGILDRNVLRAFGIVPN